MPSFLIRRQNLADAMGRDAMTASSPVAVWRVTRTDEPVPGNLVGWGTAPTLEAAARQAVDYAVDATFFGGHQITYSDLNDDERAVVDATFVNPIVVEVRDFTVETMWDTTGAFVEVAS